MAHTPERLEYKRAIADRDWSGALAIVRQHPETFGTPPDGLPDEMACLVSDPAKPTWMIVEWYAEKALCKDKRQPCRPYRLTATQFDHLEGEPTDEEVRVWFEHFVENRRAHAPATRQLGQTLYLLRVEALVQITDLSGVKVDG